MPRVALDTNLLVYLEGYDDPGKAQTLRRLFGELPVTSVVIPVQVLGELHRVLVRKLRRSPSEATAACAQYASAFEVWPTSTSCFEQASTLSAAHGMAIWDAIILGAASEAGCEFLLSEDVFYNARIAGVTILNPLNAGAAALLSSTRSSP